MSKYTEEQDDVQFSEPILAKKQVRCGIQFAEHTQWEVKTKKTWDIDQVNAMQDYLGKRYDALKLAIQISDDSVKTEHAEAKPKLTIEDQFNLESYPYFDKKAGIVKKMGKSKLYQFEQAFGFDPVFMLDGQTVAPFVTKAGNKVAPKLEGVKRVINPDFFNAYFRITTDEFGAEKAIPVLDNWVGKVVYADIEVETSEQFGSKNVIARYVKAPVI